MDSKNYLDKIKTALHESMVKRARLYSDIFKQYNKILEKSSEEAGVYLAENMGMLSQDFSIYFTALAAELLKIGKKEASESMQKMPQNFLDNYNNFRTLRIDILANNATETASGLI